MFQQDDARLHCCKSLLLLTAGRRHRPPPCSVASRAALSRRTPARRRRAGPARGWMADRSGSCPPAVQHSNCQLHSWLRMNASYEQLPLQLLGVNAATVAPRVGLRYATEYVSSHVLAIGAVVVVDGLAAGAAHAVAAEVAALHRRAALQQHVQPIVSKTLVEETSSPLHASWYCTTIVPKRQAEHRKLAAVAGARSIIMV